MPMYVIKAVFLVDGQPTSDLFQAQAPTIRHAINELREQLEFLGKKSDKKITDIRFQYKRDRRKLEPPRMSRNEKRRMQKLAEQMKNDPEMIEREKKIIESLNAAKKESEKTIGLPKDAVFPPEANLT